MRPITRWQNQFLGLNQFPLQLGEHELDEFFTFSPEEVAEIKAKFKDRYCIPVAMMVGFIRMTGRTMSKVPKALPRDFLKFLGDQFEVPAPSIASLRSLYKHKSTLSNHQDWAIEKLGFKEAGPKHDGRLFTHMLKQSRYKADVDLLVESGKVWLYQRSLLITGDTRLVKMARRVVARSEKGLYSLIMASVPSAQLETWEKRILAQMPDLGCTYMEWLAAPPRKRNLRAIRDRIDRIDFLRELKVNEIALQDVALEKIHLYANDMRQMRPAKFAQLKDEQTRTIRLVCFLRHCLTETTDTTVAMCHRHIWDIWTDCEEKAKEKDAEVAISQRSLLNEIFYKVDTDINDAEFRAVVRELKKSDKAPQHPSRAAAARYIMTEPNSPVRALLQQVQRLDINYSIDSQAAAHMVMVKGLYGRKVNALPPDTFVKSRAWQSILEGDDRERALRALEAQTLMSLRKELRNGHAWIEASGAFRNRDELLISPSDWDKSRRRHYSDLGLPLDPNDFLEPLRQELKKKLQMVAAASDKGELHIEDGMIHIPRVTREKHPKAWVDACEKLGDLIPKAQLPDVILHVDARAGFSRALLNRPARSEEELIQVYAGMLAHATGLDATAVALMLPGVDAEQVKAGMEIFQEEAPVRAANDAIVALHRKFPVTKVWGDGSLASSDSMSVDVSPKVWKSRKDYRRKVASIGVYTHVLDQWILFHDYPIMLNERQAGIALEGVIRHRELGVDMLAVDTHGYTEFGMCQGGLLKVAFVPRIKKLKERKLHCPSNIAIPAQLESVTTREIPMATIRQYWDELVRIAASIETGKVSATIALARFGTAAQGDPVYHAGVALGRLVRSLFLCDYFLDAEFRREINRILAHGESIHTLQRAICTGSFSKPRGARDEELIALSGSLTLLTNICLVWTTSQIQSLMDKKGGPLPDWLKIVSPARTAHINFRGTFKFAVAAYADRLIAGGPLRRVVG